MDSETAKACLDEYPRKNEYLTAFGVNQWREARQIRPKQIPDFTLCEDDWEPPTEDEKRRVKKLVSAFRASKPAQSSVESKLKPIQHEHSLEELFEIAKR